MGIIGGSYDLGLIFGFFKIEKVIMWACYHRELSNVLKIYLGLMVLIYGIVVW
jgi:hypothetical protein